MLEHQWFICEFFPEPFPGPFSEGQSPIWGPWSVQEVGPCLLWLRLFQGERVKREKVHSRAPESRFGTGSRSQGPRPNNRLPWSSRKTFITSPHSPLAEKANCELRKLMTLKLSIYLGLSPPYEMPQKVPVSLFLSEEAWI